jgi:hypothetical protein
MDTEKSNKGSHPTDQDPPSGRGSHPAGAGTAAGAIAMGAAGAVVGSGVGPIGAGVGAITGAAVGALAGHTAIEQFGPVTRSDLGRTIDYKVVDRNNEKIGTVTAVWRNQNGQPSYIAISTGWLSHGKTHVVPVRHLMVNDQHQKLRVPYLAEKVKSAPTFESEHYITAESELQIHDYFGAEESGPSPSRG